MSLSKHQQWIVDQLEATGVSQSDLARAIGLEQSKINRITKGTRRVQLDELEKAEAFFRTLEDAPVDHVRPVSLSLVSTPISGKVRAGSFQQVDELDDQDPDEALIARDPRFPSARVLVFDVVGNSMNALEPVPIPDGSRVSGPAFEDLHGREPLSDGMVVVVQRSTADGQMLEWSIKEVESRDDGFAFLPRSTDPRFKPIIVDTDLNATDGKIVEIIALVTDVTRPLRRRR